MKKENEASENKAKHLSELQEVTEICPGTKLPAPLSLELVNPPAPSPQAYRYKGGMGLNWFYLSTCCVHVLLSSGCSSKLIVGL